MISDAVVNGLIALVCSGVLFTLTRLFAASDIAHDEMIADAEQRRRHVAIAEQMIAELDARARELHVLAAGGEIAPPPPPVPPKPLSPESHLWTAVLLPEDRDWFRAHGWHGPTA